MLYGQIKLSSFTPDLTPDELKDAYESLYDQKGPRLASMSKWPEHWINKDVDPNGWLQWFKAYHNGRRTDDDARQIQRWRSFKARHSAQFIKNPTPRRAFALRNWAIDPLQLVKKEDKAQLMKDMNVYKDKAWERYNNK